MKKKATEKLQQRAVDDKSLPVDSQEKKGYIFVVGGVFLYAFSDAIMKYFIPQYGVHQIAFMRTIFRFIPFLIYAAYLGTNPLKTKRVYENISRAILASLATYCFLSAYKFSSMTDAIVVAYTSGIFVIPLGALILNERVNFPNVIAVLLGFAGIILAFRPGLGVFQLGVMFAVISAIASALNVVIMKRLSSTEKETTIIFYHHIILIAASILMGFESFALPSLRHLLFFIAAGALGAFAQFFTVRAYKSATCSGLAPAAYVILIPTTVIDYFFYDKSPDAYIVSGLVLIILGSSVAMRKR
ncbi:MAG: DMT family transporter [Holosporaceae bacterium]|nr:DMT family transporter [Holosporaceae bacterium]